MTSFVGVRMGLSMAILCLTLINLSRSQTQPEITEKSVYDHNEENCSYYEGEKVKVSYKVNADNGTVAATFHFPKTCNHTAYEIELQTFEGVNNETCMENLSNEEMHSKRYWNSSEDEEVVFKYVFSGCYRFQIEPLISSDSRPHLYTDVKYIETNVLKTKIAEERIDIALSSYSHRNSLVVNIARNFTSEKTIIGLATLIHQHSSVVDSCQELATDHSYCDMFNGISECNSTDNIAVPECGQVNIKTEAALVPKTEGKMFYRVSEKIRCTFYNVTPGNYCVKITVDDDRCVQLSVFKSKPCTWRKIIEVKDSLIDVPAVNLKSVSVFALSLVVIVTIILLFFIGVIIYMFKRRSPMIPILDDPRDEAIPMVRKKKVLLLYPRDCKQFMTVMKSFGELLEKSLNIEVFDCYNNEDVLDGPLDWLQNKLRNPQFYVLIASSRCAYLHQEAIRAGDWGSSYSLYREPSFLDRVFMYGLQWVMRDLSATPFCKNYIIGFRGFFEDEDMNSLPTNWRRYIIPDHLDRLLTDMDIYCPTVNIKSNVQHVNLESDIHSLQRYYMDNPYYLNGILKDGIVI